MKSFATLLLSIGILFAAKAQLNTTLIGHLDHNQGVNDIWGYAAPDGTEYALVGTQNGLSVVSLEDPSDPRELFFFQGQETTWRDIKTWGHTAYSVCDNCEDGLLVVDLSNLPDEAPHYYWSAVPDSAFLSAHNIFIDEFGYGYLAGTNYAEGHTLFLDFFSTPGTPQFIGFGPQIYAHDIYARDQLMYASEIYEGRFAIYDVSDKANSFLLGTAETPSTFTHNTWLSDDGNFLYTTDERPSASTTSYDISDLDNIQLLDRFFSEASLGETTIPHNVHVLHDYLVISHYTDGCVIVDAQHPDNLVEVGNYDTYQPPRTGFRGAWGAYPYLPSGYILISDRQSGLYVIEPNYVRASYLKGTVRDASTALGIIDANISITEAGRSTESGILGIYKTGIPQSGTFDVVARKIYYKDQTLSGSFENGSTTVLDFELESLTPFTLNGSIISAFDGTGVGSATVRFQSRFYEYEATTQPDGSFSIDDFYPYHYDVSFGKWGFKSELQSLDIDQNTGTLELVLSPVYEDNFLIDLGWLVDSDTVMGAWVRAVPEMLWFGTDQIPNTYLSPKEDAAEDPGNYAMVTGNSEHKEDAFLLGFTRLVSPVIDMMEWYDPRVSFYQWLSSLRGGWINNPEAGWGSLSFKIFNGQDTVLIDRWEADTNVFPEWELREYKILDFLPKTDRMQFVFEARGPREEDFNEAGIDFFRAWDDNPDGTDNRHRFDVSIFPNPFVETVMVEYDIGAVAEAEAVVYDVLGRVIVEEPLLTTKGTLTFGVGLPPGVYFLEFRCGEETESFRLLKK